MRILLTLAALLLPTTAQAEGLTPKQMNTVADEVAMHVCGEQSPRPYHLQNQNEKTPLEQCWKLVPPLVTAQLAEGQCSVRTGEGLIDCMVTTVIRLAPMEGLPLVELKTSEPSSPMPPKRQPVNCVEMAVDEDLTMERWCYQNGQWYQEPLKIKQEPKIVYRGTL